MIYIDKENNEITFKEWQALQHDWNYRHIAQAVNTNNNKVVTISTVWSGIAIEQDEQGRPLIYATSVEVDNAEIAIVSYPTQEEAMDGHRAVCLAHGIQYDDVVPKRPFNELRVRQ